MSIRAVDLQRLINLYGEELTLVGKSFGVYDPTTGTTATTNEETEFLGYNAMYDLGEIDGTTVIRGDRKIILGAFDLDGEPISPNVDDEVTGQGDRVSVVSVSKIMSGSNIICHICQVRK
jgi:hypothetical protein